MQTAATDPGSRTANDKLRIRELFQSEILKEENIGLGFEELEALWDAEFPEDPLEPPRLQAA